MYLQSHNLCKFWFCSVHYITITTSLPTFHSMFSLLGCLAPRATRCLQATFPSAGQEENNWEQRVLDTLMVETPQYYNINDTSKIHPFFFYNKNKK